MAERIEWSKKYSLEIPEIDGHHQELINYINTLNEAIEAKKFSKSFLETIAQGLIEYTNYHFSLEEEYMDMYGYPEFNAHRGAHQKFVEDIKKFQIEIRSDHREAVHRMAGFLNEWLIKHILVEDRKYADYFKQNGITIPDE